MRTWSASCADLRGRNPNEHGTKSASKIGSSTILARGLDDAVANRRDGGIKLRLLQ